MRKERAVVRRSAVLAGADVRRLRLAQHGLHVGHLRADGVMQRSRVIHNGMQLKQLVKVEFTAVIDVIPIEGEHTGLPHVQPGAPQHPELNGGIKNKVLLELGGGFDLDQPPTAPRQPFEHIDANQHPLMPERRLEQRRRRPGRQNPARLLKRLSDMAVIVRHQVPTRIPLASQLPHLVPRVEHRLQRIVRFASQVTVIGLIPEPQMALGPRHEAGF